MAPATGAASVRAALRRAARHGLLRRFSAPVVAALLLGAVLVAAFGGSHEQELPRAWLGPGVPRRVSARTTAAASKQEASGTLDELIATASAAGDDQAPVAAAVDAAFAQLKPDDLADLQARFAAAAQQGDEAALGSMKLLTACIQSAMETRMEKAKNDIDSLLMSSGDIDQNIRECLGQQDSPLPIMSVLQMNLERAKATKQDRQAQALSYVLRVMSAELEKDVPAANRLVSRLLRSEDSATRKDLLRGALQGSEADVTPAELAEALVQLVNDADRRFKLESTSEAAMQARQGTLQLIRRVAIDTGVVVGEVLGDDKQGQFTEDLQPMFEALSTL
mmetsp:Transcript_82925/g.231250  ORF Transcript_82925/g.231250 Transcript_82925/m.231250 type:complete len:336 (-) Transcript_82925:85-1092(-)